MDDDRQLLSTYLASKSEPAFAALVRRYLPLVYAAVRRQIPDPAAADDVTQAVFILLARKAPSLAAQPSISGWLLQAAHYCALDARKLTQRRTHHERKAATMRTESTSSNLPEGSTLSPHLDAALSRLSPLNRSIITLKYLEDRTAEQVGAAIGLSTDATHKRIHRALEKLRTALSASTGEQLSAAALPALFAASPSVAVPAHLYTTIPGVALHTTLASTAPSALIAKGASHMMYAFKLKFAVVAAFVVITILGSTALIVAGAQTADSASPASPAGPVTSGAIATLPSGVTVQLLALAEGGRQPRSFWNPDGSAPSATPAIPGFAKVRAGAYEGLIERKFAVQFRFPKNLDIDVDSTNYVTRDIARTTEGDTAAITCTFATTFRTEEKTANLRFNIATGPWFTGIVGDSRRSYGAAHPAHNNDAFAVSKPLSDNGILAFVVATNVGLSSAHRFIVTDKYNKQFIGENEETGAAPGLRLMTYRFLDLLPDDVKEASYSIRPYDQFIEFRNVSLLANTSTQIEIVTSGNQQPK